MEESRFFKLVWRFNALVISLVGIASLALLVFAGYQIIKEVTRDRGTRNIVNIEDTLDVKQEWRLGGPVDICNLPIAFIPLFSNQRFEQRAYSKESRSVRNYLFMNTEANSERWLLSDNRYLIESYELIKYRNCNKSASPNAIMYKVVKSDSNSDNRLTIGDRLTIAFSKPDGTGYREVIQDVDFLNGSKLVNPKSLLLIYQRDNTGYSARVNLNNFDLSDEKQLPKISVP